MGRSLSDGIRRFGQFFRPARLRVLVSVVIGFVRIAASLSFVWICKNLVDTATGKSDADFGPGVCILLCIITVQILSNLASNWWEKRNIVLTSNKIRFDCFSYVLKSRWDGQDKFHSGDVTNRLEEDVRVITELVCTRIPDVVVTFSQLVAASIYLTSMAPQLLWLLLGLMVVGVVGSRLFFRTLRKLTEKIREAESTEQQHIQENIRNRLLVLTMTGTERVLTRLGLIQKDVAGFTVKRLDYNAVARGFMGFGFMAGYSAAFLWGVFGIKDGSVTYGMMTAFLQLVGQIQKPVADLARHVPAFIHAITSNERLLELTDLPLMEDGGMVMLDEAPTIAFTNVSYTYPGRDEKVLDNFNFTFKAGELTAICGETGAGKSTLVRLAMGMSRPDEGTVTSYPLCNYMYVPQGNSLMSGTIRENLLLADECADDEDMKKVLHTAVADFVLSLPKGLDSRCGEDGSGLSEGQAQRIAIARALLHKGGILIMDESTSALDSTTEERLLENIIKEYRGRKTILFVSHREKVADCADSVCSLFHKA